VLAHVHTVLETELVRNLALRALAETHRKAESSLVEVKSSKY